MANSFETSFIPQQPLLRVEGTAERHEPVNFALVIALIVFFVSVGISVGLYFWKIQVENQITVKEEELAALEKTINIDEINTYKRLQVKLNTAKQLVNSHTIFSVIFDLLEEKASQNIGLTSLSYGIDANRILLSLQGQAPSYEALYFQIETWRSMRPIVRSAEMRSLALDEMNGIVSFQVEVNIDPSYVQNATVVRAVRPAPPEGLPAQQNDIRANLEP